MIFDYLKEAPTKEQICLSSLNAHWAQEEPKGAAVRRQLIIPQKLIREVL